MTVDKIVTKVKEFSAKHCVLTGGEPMIADGINELADELHLAGKHITIETAGTVAPGKIACDLASLSPKLSNSIPDDRLKDRWRERHEKLRLQPEIIRQWIEVYDYQLKFVVSSPTDIDEINDFIGRIGCPIAPEKVQLMPEGTTPEVLGARTGMVVKLCRQFGYRYCSRLHIDLFGNKRGT